MFTAFRKDAISQLIGSECEVAEEALLRAPSTVQLMYKNNEIIRVPRS